MKNGLTVVGLFVVMAMVFPTGTGADELTVDEHTVALWHFNEGSGNIVYDESGNGNHGTIHGATWTTGMFGSALSFDGVNDYVEIPYNTGLDITDKITVMAWVIPDATKTFHGIMTHYGRTDDTHGWHWIIIGDPQRRLRFGIRKGDDSGWVGAYHEANWSSTEWNLIVGTYDGEYLRDYLNGEEVGSSYYVGTLRNEGNQPIVIGRFYTTRNVDNFKGAIDEVAIYNRALTAEEIAEIASRNRRPIADAGLDQAIFEEVALDGTGSYDPEEEPLIYTWYEDLNKNEILEDDEIIATGPTPTLTYTETDIGIYYYQLIVNDGELDSKPDTVTIGVAGEGRPKPNMAFNISQMKIHWVGNNRGTIHFEIPELPEGITSQDDLLPQGTIITIEIPTKADPNEYAVGQDEIDFNIYRKLWNTLPQHIRPEKQR